MSRKMKDSGVEWIGEIPENWNCYKMKFKGILASNGVDKKIEEGQETCKAVHYMGVYRNSLSTIENNNNCLTVSANQKQFIDCQLEKGDLLFTNSSETPEDIGHSTLIETTMPKTLFGNSNNSPAIASSKPWTWAIPSPTSKTVPTPKVSNSDS